MPKRAAEECDVADTSKKAKLDEGTTSVELQKDEEGSYYLDLGSKKRASVSIFKEKPWINIREFYSDKSGELKPGKKGIALTPAQWDALLSGAASLSKQLKAAGDGNKEEKENFTEKEKPKAKADAKATKAKGSTKKLKKESEAESDNE